jgi:hypothetical protein
MVIGHEAHYSVDNRENRLGVVYNRRAGLSGSTQERINQAYEAALWAARKLEDEPELGGSLKFNEHDVEIWVNDRLLAPNDPETIAAFKSEVSSFLSNRFGAVPDLQTPTDARDLVRVRTLTASNR